MSDPLSLNDTLSLMSGAFGHFQTLWGAFFAVIFGVLTAVTSLKFRDRRTRVSIKVAMTLAFGLFAFSNYGALEEIRGHREHLATYATELLDRPSRPGAANSEPLKLLAAMPPTAWELGAAHLVADLVVIILIVFAPNAAIAGMSSENA